MFILEFLFSVVILGILPIPLCAYGDRTLTSVELVQVGVVSFISATIMYLSSRGSWCGMIAGIVWINLIVYGIVLTAYSTLASIKVSVKHKLLRG